VLIKSLNLHSSINVIRTDQATLLQVSCSTIWQRHFTAEAYESVRVGDRFRLRQNILISYQLCRFLAP